MRGGRSRCSSPTSCCSTCSCPTAAAWTCSPTPSWSANAEIVLITGHASLDTSIQALRLGAADYLVKPVNLRQLQGVLSRS
jgi:DNA-binding NtrC family response regulator